MHNVKVEDALGASLSYLHAMKMALESCDALGGGGRDYCAFHLLVDSAEAEIIKAQSEFDLTGNMQLTELISGYLVAQKIWEAQFAEDCDKATDSAEWRKYMELSRAIIDFPCSTMMEIQHRARFMLSQENLVDLLANCATDAAVRDFLKSMIAVDNGEN